MADSGGGGGGASIGSSDAKDQKSERRTSTSNSGGSTGSGGRISRSGSLDLSPPNGGGLTGGGTVSGATLSGGLNVDTKVTDSIALMPLHSGGGTAGNYHQIPLLLEYDKKASSIRVDFTTIDWFFSTYKLKAVFRAIREKNRERGWVGWATNHYLNIQGWLVLLAVGICTAITASFIHTAAKWLGEIKLGACRQHGFWLDQTLCCLDVESLDDADPGRCLSWVTWAEWAGLTSTAGSYMFNYFIYICFGVCCAHAILVIAACLTAHPHVQTLFAGLASWLVIQFAHKAAGSGIAEIQVILGGFIMKNVLGFWTLFIKSIGLVLSVASGLNLGKEGPMVHISCCWGNVLSRQFSKFSTNEVKKREILSAAAAAGVSVAFGAPLGGVLFSLESMSSYFPPKTMWRSFWCAIAAALLLQWLDPFNTGKLVQFQITYHHQWSYFEIVPFAILGALGGLLGALMINGAVRVSTFRRRHAWLTAHPITEVICVAFVTSLLNYSNIYVRYSSTDLLERLFGDCSEYELGANNNILSGLCSQESVGANIALLTLAGILKLVLTMITYGSMVPAGIFIPSLCIGACMGRVLGWAMMLWHESIQDTFIFAVCSGRSQCISPGIYAMIGAAAVLGGVTRMTVSLAVIMFELTGGLEYIVPIVIAIVCSKLAADAFGTGGLYTQLIRIHGFPHIDAKTDLDTEGLASDVMIADPIALTTYGQTLQSIRTLLDAHSYHGFPIINNDIERILYGFVSRTDLLDAIDNLDADESVDGLVHIHFSKDPAPFNSPKFLDFSAAVDAFPVHVVPGTPVERILDMFKRLGLRYILVSNHRGRLQGLIKKKDLLLFLSHGPSSSGIAIGTHSAGRSRSEQT